MVKLSVIVPVYNVEQYLKQCLNSIVNQTLKDIEIIVVNDGSTDTSLHIINEFAELYPNIIALNKENGGLSSARNYGMNYANGEFISFIDSDDFIDNNMMEELYTLAKDNDADMVISKIKVYENSVVTRIKPNIYYTHKYVLNGEESIEEFLKTNITGHAWNKIYRKELFTKNNILYPEGLLYEDNPTTIQLLSKSNKVILTNNSYYYYRQREEAITRKISYKAVKDHFLAVEFVNEYVKKLKVFKLQYYLQEFIINELAYNYKLLIKYRMFNTDKYKMLNKHEKLIKEQIKKISVLKFTIEAHFHGKTLLKLLLIKLNLYKLFVNVS